jgi:hypothetical protein
MRSNPLRIAVASVALLVAFVAAAPPARAYSEVSFEFFHSSLSPHGSWVASASYGQVWHPYRVDTGWHPYSHGHWVYTDLGWTWVSSYSWGAIPFHYGTWVIEPAMGWVWVPGYVWAPAWVVYRSGPSYIGWAPVAPSFSFGVSFNHYDYYEPDHFVFVPDRHFCDRDVYRYAAPVSRRRVIYKETTIINNNITIDNDVVVNRGLDVRRVERVAARRPERMRIDDVPRVAPMERVSREQWRRNPREALRVDRTRFEDGPVRVVSEERRSGRDGGGRDAREARRREDTVVQAPATARNRESVGERERNERERIRDESRVQEQREPRDRRERAVREDQQRARDRSARVEQERTARDQVRAQKREHARDLEQQMRQQRERALRDQAQVMRREQDRSQERARAMRDQEQQIRREQERAMRDQQRAQERERARDQEQQMRHEQERSVRAQEQQVRREQRQQEQPRQERRGRSKQAQEQEEGAPITPADPGPGGHGRR